MAEKTIMWQGASGKGYEYWIHPMGTTFEDSPGNYIFAKEISPNRWTPIYIGECENLNDRLSSLAHEKIPCVEHYGGTHIHSHITPGAAKVRKVEESDLLAKWDPPCNKE